MNKPRNYDNTKAGNGEFQRVELGAHRAIIKQVQETTSKAGKPMIAVLIDFAAEDAQAGYFQEQFNADTREEKKWPFQAVQYILTEDSDGNTSRSFKSFCTAYEDSNGREIKWGGENWGQQFKGRRIGAVFGEVEEEYNGEIKTRRRIRWFCDDHKTKDQQVPQLKPYKGPRPAAAAPNGEEWATVPSWDEESLPF